MPKAKKDGAAGEGGGASGGGGGVGGSGGKHESRASVLEVVKGPIGLLALVVLVVEGALLALLALGGLTADQKFWLGLAMVGLVAMSIIAAVVVSKPASRESAGSDGERVDFQFDVFLSAPMAALDSGDYEKSRAEIMRVVQVLRTECRYRVFFAGENIESAKQFEKAPTVARDDMDMLVGSRLFVLVHPKTMQSSTLVEAGMALALDRDSLYFVKAESDLPYLLRAAVKDKKVSARSVVYKDPDDLVEMIKREGKTLIEGE